MIRIRVEVLVTRPLLVRAETVLLDRVAKIESDLPDVEKTVGLWIGQYARAVQRAADELVPR